MKYSIKFFLLCVAFGITGLYAQQTDYCGTSQKEMALRQSHPEILIEEQKLDQFVKDWIASNSATLRDDQTYVIPIVFHIIHDYGIENISDAQVRDAVRIINEDYQLRNADTTAIVPSFQNIKGKAKVEFRLANKTPGGECTNGINHIHSLSTNIGDDGSKLDDWPRNWYLNVWTVKTMADNVAGYAYLPGSVSPPWGAPYDGVIILSDYVGSIGTSNTSHSRALTHEIGHTMNLDHTWGSTNQPGVECGDDGVEDTPETKGWSYCNLNGSICNPPIIENVQNFMEYSYCSKMFTEGQVAVMRGILNSPSADRNNLWTDENLLLTGTNDSIEPLCTPRIDFYSTNVMACTGAGITFYDASWSGAEDSRTWTFQDGNPATSSLQAPVVSFSSPGWKTVTLSASNTAGTSSLTREKYVYVSDNTTAQYTIGYWETFEDADVFSNDWVVQNPEGNSAQWNRVSDAGYNSSSSARLNNFHNMNGDKDNLISPSFDLSAVGSVYLNFRYSCATASAHVDDINDDLRIYSSLDCGKTWSLRTTISAIDLAAAGCYSTGYVPTWGSIWKNKSVLLPSAVLHSNVRFKFEYTTNGAGNNIYIDDVNINTHPVGMNDPDAVSFTLNVFPNPLSENSLVVLQQKISGMVNVRIVDLLGRTTKMLNDGWLGEGTHKFDLKASDMREAGLYFLVADDGVNIYRQKIVVQ